MGPPRISSKMEDEDEDADVDTEAGGGPGGGLGVGLEGSPGVVVRGGSDIDSRRFTTAVPPGGLIRR